MPAPAPTRIPAAGATTSEVTKQVFRPAPPAVPSRRALQPASQETDLWSQDASQVTDLLVT
jgi:hypothetical protein